MRVFFRNNFNLQEGLDGGVLEVSFDNGLTFQDILTAGGTFIYGGYNGSISTCCGNPLAGREAWTGQLWRIYSNHGQPSSPFREYCDAALADGQRQQRLR